MSPSNRERKEKRGDDLERKEVTMQGLLKLGEGARSISCQNSFQIPAHVLLVSALTLCISRAVHLGLDYIRGFIYIYIIYIYLYMGFYSHWNCTLLPNGI